MDHPRHRSLILSDTIWASYSAWMAADLTTSYNRAALALWRAEAYNLWLTDLEERYLFNAMRHPPQTESRL